VTAYCTKEDLIERFGQVALAQLTDKANAQTINDVAVEKECVAASRLIDGYISHQCKVPLNQAPDQIRVIARDLAYRALHGLAKEGDSVLLLEKAAMAKLRDYAANRARVLGVDDKPATPIPQVVVVAPVPVFSERLLARMP
jgi:phage gp36-like protein